VITVWCGYCHNTFNYNFGVVWTLEEWITSHKTRCYAYLGGDDDC
jgi:hypothetical protein